jgi:hypothetical protein
MLAAASVLASGESVADDSAGERLTQGEQELEIVDRIQAEEALNGPHSPALLGLLTDLSLRYEDSGDAVLAMAAIERAIDVVRVNEGLYSLNQAPLAQRLIDIETARGDARAAWAHEQQLLALARRDPGDPRAAQVFRAAADRRIQFLEIYLTGKRPLELVLGCYYQVGKFIEIDRVPFGSCQSGRRSVAIENIRADAAQLYGAAGDVVAQQALERQLPTDWPRVIR